MALKKGATAPPARGSAVKVAAARPAAQERSPGGGGSDSTRMLREAAWSRMFGRVESKNPFTR
jgi:hypothetical protein